MSDHSGTRDGSQIALEETIIRPRRGWASLQLAELVHYRELLTTLALRDIKVRYKQTALGAAWAVIQPLAQMIVFTVFFATHGFSTEGAPASIFYFAGLLPWQLFATSVSAAGNSLVANRTLITKVYFPRLVIPLAVVASAGVDFAISFAVLLVIMAVNKTMPAPTMVFLPAFFLLAVVTALGIGIWLSILNVKFRDVQYVIPFLVQFWLFVTPVIYPSSSVTGLRRILLGVNPMSGVVEGFRWCILGRPAPSSMLLVSIVSGSVILVTGILFFRRTERTFADQL